MEIYRPEVCTGTCAEPERRKIEMGRGWMILVVSVDVTSAVLSTLVVSDEVKYTTRRL